MQDAPQEAPRPGAPRELGGAAGRQFRRHSSDALELPHGTTALILASGKTGHEVQCRGVAQALGLDPVIKVVDPRPFFARLAPYGPTDPRDRRAGGLLAEPSPDIVLASGRITVPYFRAIKRLSRGRTFAVFLQDPRWGRGSADLIWVPAHDRLRGPNVLATLTSPHPFGASSLQEAQANPDPCIAGLPPPRLTMSLGGPSGAFRFEPSDIRELAAIAVIAAQAGFSVLATPSRRTPPEAVEAIKKALAGWPNHFVWDGEGANPYRSMLANADAIVVTGDSVNMMGEALATRASTYVYTPTGGDEKMRGFVDQLVAKGALRRWNGRIEFWDRDPLDATIEIAHAVRERYLEFRR